MRGLDLAAMGIPSQQDAAVLRTGQPICDHLELHWYEPHKPGWCLTTKLPLRDATGTIVGLIGLSRDVRAPIHHLRERVVRLARNVSQQRALPFDRDGARIVAVARLALELADASRVKTPT